MEERVHSTFSHHRFVQVSDLNKEERDWFAHALGNAIVSDHHISAGQLKWIENAMLFLPPAQRNKFLDRIKRKEHYPLKILRVSDREKAGKMFMDFVLIILENFIIDEDEKKFLTEVGRTLGIKERRCIDIINWANELIRIFHLKDGYIDRIRRDESDYPDYLELE